MDGSKYGALPQDALPDTCGASATSKAREALLPFCTRLNKLSHDPNHAASCFKRDGLLYLQEALPERLMKALLARVDSELAERRADSNFKHWFGDVYGSDDGDDKGCRWDLKLRMSPEVRAVFDVILEVLQPMLEAIYPGWQLAELAAMCTFPGDPAQPVHSDTSHIYDKSHVTMWVALHDVEVAHGPTKMYPRTHTNPEVHMGYTKPDEDSAILCGMRCGDIVLMDSRLLHCGTANVSAERRFLFYSTWMPPVRRSTGSTNTLLPEYEEKVALRHWRENISALCAVASQLPENVAATMETKNLDAM